MSVLYGHSLREFKQHNFKLSFRVRISNIDLPFRVGYKSQFTAELFQIIAIANINLNVHHERWTESGYTRENLWKWTNPSHLRMDSLTEYLVASTCFSNFLPEQVNLDGQREVAISEISQPSMYQNVTEWEYFFHSEKLSKTKSL